MTTAYRYIPINRPFDSPTLGTCGAQDRPSSQLGKRKPPVHIGPAAQDRSQHQLTELEKVNVAQDEVFPRRKRRWGKTLSSLRSTSLSPRQRSSRKTVPQCDEASTRNRSRSSKPPQRPERYSGMTLLDFISGYGSPSPPASTTTASSPDMSSESIPALGDHAFAQLEMAPQTPPMKPAGATLSTWEQSPTVTPKSSRSTAATTSPTKTWSNSTSSTTIPLTPILEASVPLSPIELTRSTFSTHPLSPESILLRSLPDSPPKARAIERDSTNLSPQGSFVSSSIRSASHSLQNAVSVFEDDDEKDSLIDYLRWSRASSKRKPSVGEVKAHPVRGIWRRVCRTMSCGCAGKR